MLSVSGYRPLIISRILAMKAAERTTLLPLLNDKTLQIKIAADSKPLKALFRFETLSFASSSKTF